MAFSKPYVAGRQTARLVVGRLCTEEAVALQVRIDEQSRSPERLLLLTSKPRSAGSEDGHEPGSVPSRLQSPALRSCRPPVLLGWEPHVAGKGPPRCRVPPTRSRFRAGKLPLVAHSPGRVPCTASKVACPLNTRRSKQLRGPPKRAAEPCLHVCNLVAAAVQVALDAAHEGSAVHDDESCC